MSELLIVNAEDVRNILNMPLCIDAVAEAMKALSNDTINVPLRSFAKLRDDKGVLAIMPGSSSNPPTFGLKVLSLLPQNPASNRPAIQGFTALFCHETGRTLSIIEAASVTAIRTAAASGVATRELARKDVETHGIVGTGVQCDTHASAILSARPNIQETRIWGRNFNKAQTRASELSSSLKAKIVAVKDIQDVSTCDVVSAVTASSEPLILNADVQDGAHINLVGSHTPNKREACSDTVARARLYVDVKSAALSEAGDILIPMKEGRITENDIVGEIGEVLNGQIPKRSSEDEVTLYKSLGNAAQDLLACWAVYEAAKEKGVGQWVTF